MNKKLLIALSSVGVAAGFWACGSGSVEPMSDDDSYVQAMLDQGAIDFAVQVADAKASCASDPACESEMAKAQGAAVMIESSSTPATSSDTPTSSPSTSSSDFFKFSSSGPIGGVSSSSAPISVPSSSSATLAPGTFGTCKAGSETAELNANVTWTFSWDTKSSGLQTADILSASFAWTFEGGTPATGSSKSATTAYAVSGPKTAVVSVSAGGATQDISCSVNVNGAPITGCQCVSDNITPDVSKGESAQWSVAGCKTGTGLTLSYKWTGATADATGMTATAPVAAKGDVVTGVSVLVENGDNTQVTVPCEDAKAMDATQPDYLFEISGDQVTSAAIDVANEGCMSIRGNWTNTGYSPNIQVLCDGRSDDQNVGMTFSMTYAGKEIATTTGTWGFSNAGGAIGKVSVGDIAFDNICVTFTGASTVSCKIQ